MSILYIDINEIVLDWIIKKVQYANVEDYSLIIQKHSAV